MGNIDRLFSEAVIILLLLGLEYFAIRPLIGDGLGYVLVGVTVIVLILDVLRNAL